MEFRSLPEDGFGCLCAPERSMEAGALQAKLKYTATPDQDAMKSSGRAALPNFQGEFWCSQRCPPLPIGVATEKTPGHGPGLANDIAIL